VSLGGWSSNCRCAAWLKEDLAPACSSPDGGGAGEPLLGSSGGLCGRALYGIGLREGKNVSRSFALAGAVNMGKKFHKNLFSSPLQLPV
jgi:hypothetical protein